MVLAPFLVIYSIVGLAMLAALLLYIELSLISRAFVVLGLSPRTALSVLFISLIGSYANIPLYTVPAGPELSTESVNNFGVIYTIPREYGGAGTTVAINVGGAIVPIAVAAYALAHSPAAILPAVAATTIVALVTHRVAY